MSIRTCQHRLSDVIALFDGLFADTYRTRLVRGGDEPLYLPASAKCAHHQVVFARGFFASALHEVSHWCIAGARRRMLQDYGYWYLPDGRDAKQQEAFENAEVAPQALEMLFARACNFRFHVSVDNLGEASVDRAGFQARVEGQAARYCREGLPHRGEAFRVALAAFYRQGLPVTAAVEMGRKCMSSRASADSRCEA